MKISGVRFNPRLNVALYAVLSFAAGVFNAHAATPGILNYQGRVQVSGADYSGTGLFKFALVDAAGTTTYWSNDGTSTGGSEPTNAITLNVAKGLYAVLLGDATIPNMTTIPISVFNNSVVKLRIWFNDGTNGSLLLSPDQRIASAGFAIMAAAVDDGSVTTAKIANGAVGNTQLAANAVQSANIANGAVGSNQLAAPAVFTANVSDGSITQAKLDPAVTALIAAAKVATVQNYGTSSTTGTVVNQSNLKICFGQATMAGVANQTISGLPFTNVNTYSVIATRNNVNGYTTQAVVVAKVDGTQFIMRDFTTDSPINWIAIGF